MSTAPQKSRAVLMADFSLTVRNSMICPNNLKGQRFNSLTATILILGPTTSRTSPALSRAVRYRSSIHQLMDGGRSSRRQNHVRSPAPYPPRAGSPLLGSHPMFGSLVLAAHAPFMRAEPHRQFSEYAPRPRMQNIRSEKVSRDQPNSIQNQEEK